MNRATTCGLIHLYKTMIRLQGKWLEELGFRVGDRVVVVADEGKIVITKTGDTASPAQLSLNLVI